MHAHRVPEPVYLPGTSHGCYYAYGYGYVYVACQAPRCVVYLCTMSPIGAGTLEAGGETGGFRFPRSADLTPNPSPCGRGEPDPYQRVMSPGQTHEHTITRDRYVSCAVCLTVQCVARRVCRASAMRCVGLMFATFAMHSMHHDMSTSTSTSRGHRRPRHPVC
jgi:hypothetical protein